MSLQFDTCPKCRSLNTLMSTAKNPMAQPLCFDCIVKIIDIHNIHDAEKFCRTYNIPFSPDVWIKLEEQIPVPSKMVQTYAEAMLDERNNALDGSTGEFVDRAGLTFEKINMQWAQMIKQREIISKIAPLKEAFIEREQLNWGDKYNFEDLLKLNDLYIQSLRANSITNPIQKESLRTLLKIMIDINKAIVLKDTRDLKSLTTAFSTMAKTAQLDNLIEETHTDDLTTLAEIVQIVEDSGFEMPYYDGKDRDGIDIAIHNITESNARLVRTATGLGPQIEQMIAKYKQEEEEKKTKKAEEEVSITDLLDHYDEAQSIEEEDDSLLTEEVFE